VRSTVRVRTARADDLPALLALAEELRDATNLRHHLRVPTPADDEVRARFARLLTDPDRWVLVAVDTAAPEAPEGGEVVIGMTMLVPDVLALLSEHRVAHVTHLLVGARYRRRGGGRALLTAAVGYAEEHGYDQIVVGVSPHSREANRYFARLGFVPMVTQRLASTAMLRRSLGLPEPVAEVRLGPAVGRMLRATRRRPRALSRARLGRNLGRDLV